MSDSELSEVSATPPPPDANLEKALRREVLRANKAGEEFTLRTVRTAVEKTLGLKEGWFKKNEEWSTKSKEIIHNQIESNAEVAPTPIKSKKAQSDNLRTKQEKSTSPITTKRVADGNKGPPKKRRKTGDESSTSLTEPGSESESDVKPQKSKPPNKAKPKPAAKQDKPAKRSAESEADVQDQDEVGNNKEEEEKSDSEMSVLIDEEPQPRKKGKSKDVPDSKPKTTGSTKSAKPKSTTEEDPDQAEIKRLQGWLVKCGIRKVWGKELKPFETPKAKIKHLRQMLSDAGMTGRYSVEKATQIKEARELAADIEAVQEGAERWGADDEDGDETKDDSSRPGRRLVRGAKNYDFLSSDGEETD